MNDLVANYFATLDHAIEQLSRGQEEHLTGLPPWLLRHREIKVASLKGSDIVVVTATPKSDLEADDVRSCTAEDRAELNAFIAPWTLASNSPKANIGISVAGIYAVGDTQNINDVSPMPIMNDYFGSWPKDVCQEALSEENAKHEALRFWNNAVSGLPYDKSFISNVREIFSTFAAIIKRKAFKEKRIHHYLNRYRHILLPEFRTAYFEHPLFLGEERRVADFILEREKGFPGMLIELENPTHGIFTKNGDFTKEVNHAKRQIADWVRLINENPANSQGCMDFLKGQKHRLIVIGRGLENRDKLMDTRNTDTIIWTYELLLEMARERWNSVIEVQCSSIGIKNPNKV